MRSTRSEFKLFDRGFKNTIVLIPGWATDYRIFANLNLNYNYLLPIKFSPFSFEKGLLEYLNKISIDKISLFGWSLGGFLATGFASRNADRINELILLGIRKKFDPMDLKGIELKLKKNKKVYLYKFYLECFSNADLEGKAWFKKHLLENYTNKMKLESLLYGLDYLSQVEIKPKSLASMRKIRIFHGKDDKIVPFKEVVGIKLKLPRAVFICLPGLGHIPFLNQKFKEKFCDG